MNKKTDRIITTLFAIVLVLCCTLEVFSQSKTPPSKEAKPKQSIAALVAQLDSNHFEKRQLATRKLAEIGFEAIHLVSQAATSNNMEVSLRAMRVLRRLSGSSDLKTEDAAYESLLVLSQGGNTFAARQARSVVGLQQIPRQNKAIARLKAKGVIFSLPYEDTFTVDQQMFWNRKMIRVRNGRQVVINGNWTMEIPESAGHNVVIDHNFKGELTDLRLLHRITDLKHLTLSGSRVTDDWLRQIKTLNNISTLSITETSITDAGLLHLTDLGELRSLELSNTKITEASLKTLAQFKTLAHLGLRQTNITRLHLADMAKLETVAFESDKVTSIELKNMKSLQSINLAGANLKHIHFDKLPSLLELELNLDKFENAGLSMLEGMPSLQMLALEGKSVTDEQLSHLKNLRNLYTLSIKRSSVTGAGLKNLAGLQSLYSIDLYYSPVTDEHLSVLTTLRSCRQIKLYGTDVTEAGVRRLRRSSRAIVDFRQGALLGISASTLNGGPCVISSVKSGTAAHRAGLKPGDVIVRIEETNIESFHDLTGKVGEYKAGDKITVRYQRGSKKNSTVVTLGEWP